MKIPPSISNLKYRQTWDIRKDMEHTDGEGTFVRTDMGHTDKHWDIWTDMGHTDGHWDIRTDMGHTDGHITTSGAAHVAGLWQPN